MPVLRAPHDRASNCCALVACPGSRFPGQPKYAKSEPQLAAIAKAEDALKSAREPDVDPSVAIELYTQAIEVSPQFVQLRLARAKVFEAVGRFGDAVGDVS